MMRWTLLPVLLAGCATVQPVGLATTFDPAEVAWFNAPGTNAIRGNAVLRTVGGAIKTCAGLDANLVPVSTYAAERFRKMYGDRDSGLLSATSGLSFAATDPRYAAASRTTVCNSEGNFAFSELPDGDYYVTAKVIWGVPGRYITSYQGGYVMQRVTLKGGETKEIVLTAL